MGETVKRFAGVGVVNVVVLWILFILLTVMAKVILAKYPVKGLTEVIQSV
jgi:putative flippase GtrA